VYEVEAQKNPFFAKVLKSQKDFASRATRQKGQRHPPLPLFRSRRGDV
jgi:hypothetical protein